jgi:hypothetical protein
MDYYHKYIKYKVEYNKLINQDISNAILFGGRYTCDPSKSFKELCYEEDNGIYKSKKSCVNDCEIKYINRHLIKANIKHETKRFSSFIKDMFDENMNIYIKGGTVLGLKLLKMIYEKYSDDHFEKYFNEFVKLDLIRDWDFAGYTDDKEIDEDYRNKLDEIAKKYGLVPRAKTFILYQTRKPILVDDMALFEIAILDNENLSCLELPMTTMKVKINRRNLNFVFMFAKSFQTYKINDEPFDIDVIKHMIDEIKIIICPCKDGLFKADRKTFDKGNLSKQLLHFIREFSNNDYNLQQFLITQIQEPNRLFYRLLEKNIPKTYKIIDFLKKCNIYDENPDWLFDPEYIMNVCECFSVNLGEKLSHIYKQNESLDHVSDFIDGINLSRIKIEYDKFQEKGLQMIKDIFNPLYNLLISNANGECNEKNKELLALFKFLETKKLFT